MLQSKLIHLKELFSLQYNTMQSTSITDVMPLIVDVSTASLSYGVENLFLDETSPYTAKSIHIFDKSRGNENQILSQSLKILFFNSLNLILFRKI